MILSSSFGCISTSFFLKSVDIYNINFVVPAAILAASNWIFFQFHLLILSKIIQNYVTIFEYRSDERSINDLK